MTDNEKGKGEFMNTIYQPSGEARQYAHLGLNLYRGCIHKCGYCYVPRILRMDTAAFHESAAPRKGVIPALSVRAPHFAGTNERVLLSFTSDAYQPIEEKYEVTRTAIKILKCYGIPFTVLTKAGQLAIRDFDLYMRGDSFGVTLTSLDIADADRDERGAGIPSERLAALIMAHAKGIPTWVSLEPVIDPDKSLGIIRETCEYVDHYKIGKLNYAPSEVSDDQWRSFTRQAVRLIADAGRTYWLKENLASMIGDDEYENTDTRTI